MVYGATAAAIHAATVQAVKASGVLVRVEPDAFVKILSQHRDALVVASVSGIWHKDYHYLTSYKGLAFYTKTSTELNLPGDVELVHARQIWMPG